METIVVVIGILVGSLGLFGVLFGLYQTFKVWPHSSFRPRDKNILITGGSLGLGKALAVRLVASGARSVVILARTQKTLQEAVDDIQVKLVRAAVGFYKFRNTDKIQLKSSLLYHAMSQTTTN
jgi:shikimate 5-dehydrogenase